MTQPAFTPQARAHAARMLATEKIWVRRHFWADEYDREVPEGHPDAVNHTYLDVLDYERIVDLVITHLAAAPNSTDWISDPTLSAAEKLARFEALRPAPTRGPEEQS